MQISITRLQANQFSDGLSNIIEIVSWSATDGVFTIQGSTRLNPPKQIFKPLEELQQADVVGWVKSKDEARIAKMLKATTEKQLTTTLAPPWSTEFEYVEPDEVRIIRQTYEYSQAVQRLAQYVLLDGRPELTEMQPTGEQVFNETTGEMEDVLHEVTVQTAIDPLPEFIEQAVYDELSGEQIGTETVRNPVVVKDEQERLDAQATIDATPEEIKQ
jgi:hypothetical protein